MIELHFIQRSILNKLLFSQSSKFSDLRPNDNIENNLLTYHLDQLLTSKLIEKIDNNYSLTEIGKEYAGMIDTETSHMTKQSKLSVCLIAYRKVADNYSCLIQTRLKHPFYGCQGFPTGKIKFGELITDTAERELREETGLVGNAKIFLIRHYLVHDKNTKQLLEDKIFFYCKMENPTGNISNTNEGSSNWVDEEELSKYLVKPFEEKERYFQLLNIMKKSQENVVFEEEVYYTDQF